MLSPKRGRRSIAAGCRLAPALMLWLLDAVISCAAAAVGAPSGPTVKDVVEFTRIIQPRSHEPETLARQISPDGERAFVVTRKADVRTDTNRFEILLLDLRPAVLAAGLSVAPQSLVTIEAREDSNNLDPHLQDAQWVDKRTIAFRARVADAPFQVYSVDVITRRMTQLTFEAGRMVSFAVASDLSRVVYAVQVPNPPMAPQARSVVVANQSFWSVKFGQADLRFQQRRYQYFVADAGSRNPARALGEPFPQASGSWPGADISPDGRWALLHRWEPHRQSVWARQYPLVAAVTGLGPSQQIDPLAYFSHPEGYVPRRLVAYRLSDGHEQAVVDAPDDAFRSVTQQLRADRIWQADGKSVVIAGTHLPALGGAGSLPDPASQIIEYWPDTGRLKVIAVLNGRLKSAWAIEGRRDHVAALDGDKRRQFMRLADGSWQEMTEASAADGSTEAAQSPRGRWTLRIEENLNRPADIVASGPEGRVVTLTTLNPQYSASAWGTMRPYAWTDAKGRVWQGGLMTPSRFDPAARHALVIQTYGFSPTRFYLDGPNISDGASSGFAGRAFLRENILVLALPWQSSTGVPSDQPGAILAFMDGVRAAIQSLVAQGLVDRDRIGIMGWSATGERVLNLVTFSDAPIRAATVLDGDANTLFSLTVTYGSTDNILGRKQQTNGGLPFGNSLDGWVRNDPALHSDCVKAALRIETYGPTVLNNWDVYALLRLQYKPVEMIVIPQGSHGLSRPSERMISLQGNVDWYRFWLKDEERADVQLQAETDAALKNQYLRWRQMAELKRADDAKPRCARAGGGG